MAAATWRSHIARGCQVADTCLIRGRHLRCHWSPAGGAAERLPAGRIRELSSSATWQQGIGLRALKRRLWMPGGGKGGSLTVPRGSLEQEVLPRGSVGAFADGVLGDIGGADDVSGSDLIFIGTGTSEGVPRVSCLTDPDRKCQVCWAATKFGNRNRRRNTSLLLRYAHPDGQRKNFLIDAGKFFYHSAMQWFPYYGIRNIDAVIITHSHADAIGGLDDLRDWTNNVQQGIPIYVTDRDLKVMEKTHYYLVDSSGITPGTAVSSLHFHVIGTDPFHVDGLKILPLPVWHGPRYRSLGFRFGDVCYISDVSEIPEETYPLLQNCELLIIDALRPDQSSSTHFGLPAALAEIRKIRPKRTLLTGMMHLMDHDVVNASLAPLMAAEGLDVALSYDGQRIPVSL